MSVALNKLKEQLDVNLRYKIFTLGDFNATISSHSIISGEWDRILNKLLQVRYK